jgi:hypothetical protein
MKKSGLEDRALKILNCSLSYRIGNLNLNLS